MRVRVFLSTLLIVFGTIASVNAQSAGGPGDKKNDPGGAAVGANSQQMQNVRKWFDASGLKVGSPFPAADIFDAAGKPFNTKSLRGQYTVLVNGCLT